jgi:hypothetical protein
MFGCRVVPSLRAGAWVLKIIVVYVESIRFAVWYAGGALEVTVAAMELLQLGEARWFSGSNPTLLSLGGMAFQT